MTDLSKIFEILRKKRDIPIFNKDGIFTSFTIYCPHLRYIKLILQQFFIKSNKFEKSMYRKD